MTQANPQAEKLLEALKENSVSVSLEWVNDCLKLQESGLGVTQRDRRDIQNKLNKLIDRLLSENKSA